MYFVKWLKYVSHFMTIFSCNILPTLTDLLDFDFLLSMSNSFRLSPVDAKESSNLGLLKCRLHSESRLLRYLAETNKTSQNLNPCQLPLLSCLLCPFQSAFDAIHLQH